VTSEDLTEYLVDAELCEPGDTANRSGELCCKCWQCDKKKLYVQIVNEEKRGVWFCQHCFTKGNLTSLVYNLEPESDEQVLSRSVLNYAQRQLVIEEEAQLNLLERGFTRDDIKRYGFGYLQKGWAVKFDHDDLSEYGFLTKEGLPIFWDHIIIPYFKNGQIETIKGRCQDSKAKRKYISIIGKEVPLYQPGKIERIQRLFVTEGEFKAAYLDKEGYQVLGVSGAGNAKKHTTYLNSFPDLYICLDSDKVNAQFPQFGCGQESAIAIAERLDRCHIVLLPLEGNDKMGVDDYIQQHGVQEFDKLVNAADLYVGGVLQRSSSLAIVVNEWKQKAKSSNTYIGYNIGFPRLDDWIGGLQAGSLGYIVGAPHAGKTSLLRSLAVNLYGENPELMIDYFSNDDSLKVTLGHFVAMVGELTVSDVKQPMTAYANDKAGMRKWEEATDKLSLMSDRMYIVDRSYRTSLEELAESLIKWRLDNPDAERCVLIDGFNKIYCKETQGMEDGRRVAVAKSDQLKLLAQQADVAVLVTIDPPKLYGRRPSSGDIAGSAAMEFDADLIIGCYIDAQSKGHINATELKMDVTFKDGNTETLPIIEFNLHKNKQTGTNDLDLMYLDKSTSTLTELDDSQWYRNKALVFASQRADREKYRK